MYLVAIIKSDYPFNLKFLFCVSLGFVSLSSYAVGIVMQSEDFI